MKRREKEAIIDKLLLITGISIGISLILWFIYKGYMNTAYVLGTRNLVIAIFIGSIALTLFFVWRFFMAGFKLQEGIFKNRKSKTIIVFIAISLSSLFIHYYNIYAIYMLCIFIALYLVYSFITGVYKIIAK